MEHTIEDFKRNCDVSWHSDQETYSREEVKSLLWSQIAILHNDINRCIYEHMKSQTIDVGENLRSWNDEENDIMDILKDPRCVQF